MKAVPVRSANTLRELIRSRGNYVAIVRDRDGRLTAFFHGYREDVVKAESYDILRVSVRKLAGIALPSYGDMPKVTSCGNTFSYVEITE